ncbi:hypothetical protein QUB75_08125 [Microcoleus sp. K1-B6]|uniref:hypothetical protein n=1 Tax=unclassified Microcoleus TaxID=2642155 RepID=UPI002FCE884E
MSVARARVNLIAPKQRLRSYPRYYLAHPGRHCLSRLSFNHRNLECRESDRIVVKPLSAIKSKLGDRISVMPPSAIELSSCPQVRSNFRHAPKCARIAVMPPSAIELPSCPQVRSNCRHAPKCDRIFVMPPSAIEFSSCPQVRSNFCNAPKCDRIPVMPPNPPGVKNPRLIAKVL